MSVKYKEPCKNGVSEVKDVVHCQHAKIHASRATDKELCCYNRPFVL